MDILKNEVYKSYSRLSRYSVVPVYYNTMTEKYDTGTSSYLDSTTAYSLYIVKKNDTYDKIAFEFYENPSYYWVICSFNRVQNPFDIPKVGTKLKIPSLSSIKFE